MSVFQSFRLLAWLCEEKSENYAVLYSRESEKPDFKCHVSIQTVHVGDLSEISGGSLITCLPDTDFRSQKCCPTALQGRGLLSVLAGHLWPCEWAMSGDHA